MRISDWSSDVCSSDLFVGFGIFVVSGDEGGDIGLEFRRGSVNAALQLLARQLGEPAFDLVDPGRRSWCEVHMPMRAAGKPCLDLRRLVGGIIVHHEVDVRPLRSEEHTSEIQSLMRISSAV